MFKLWFMLDSQWRGDYVWIWNGNKVVGHNIGDGVKQRIKMIGPLYHT
jgi:hypothetical protein